MRILYILLPALVILFSSTSCLFFEGANANVNGKDTIIAVQGTDDIKVQNVGEDSNQITEYWTDLDGRPLYKKSVLYLYKGMKHGIEERWDRNGTKTYNVIWSNGEMTSLTEWHNNNQVKKRIEFDATRGYARYEYNYHRNGTIKTDTIVYEQGKKNGIINYYDEFTGKLTESHIYAADELIRIKIYRNEYDRLAAQADALQRSLIQDSINRISRDSIFESLTGGVENTTTGADWSDEDNQLENIEYLKGLLKERKTKTEEPEKK